MAQLDWFWKQMKQAGYDGPLQLNGQGIASPWTPLTFASRCAPDYVRVLLEQGALVHQKETQKNQTPLLCAAAAGSIQALDVLLEYGASLLDCDQHGSNALALAILENREAMADHLIRLGCNINQESTIDQHTPIVFHLATHYPKLLSLAIEHGANLQQKTPHGQTILMHFLHHCPVLGVHATTFEEVLILFEQHGVDFNETDHYGNNALHYACARFYWAIPWLMQKGLNPNSPNEDGQTPLMNFVQHQHFLTLDYFTHHEPNWNAIRKDGCSVLFLACEKPLKLNHWQINNTFEQSELYHIKHLDPYQPPHGYLGSFDDVLDVSFCDLLLQEGAHAHPLNDHGASALMMAARMQPESLDILLQAGLDPNHKDHQGYSVLDCALRSHATREQFGVLIQAGAYVQQIKTEEHQANPDLWAYWKSLRDRGELSQHFSIDLLPEMPIRRI